MTTTNEIMELVAKRDDALEEMNRWDVGPAWKVAKVTEVFVGADEALLTAIEALVAERDALKAKLAELEHDLENAAEWKGAFVTLKEKLEKLEAQEPVAWMTHETYSLPTFHRTREAALVWGDSPVPLYKRGAP